MGRAVERLEVWTAGLLLLVAIVVGAAGTLQWVAEGPPKAAEPPAERRFATLAPPDFASTTMAQLAGAVDSAAVASQAIARLPGGALGAAAAVGAGALALPLLIAAAGSVRRVRNVGAALDLSRLGRTRMRLYAGVRRIGQAAGMPSPTAPSQRPDIAPRAEAALEAPDSPQIGTAVLVQALPAAAAQPGWVVSGRWLSMAAESSVAEGSTTGVPRPQLEAGIRAGEQIDGDEELAFAAMRAAAAVTAGCGASCGVLAVDKLNNEMHVLLDLRPGDQGKLDAAFAGGAIEAAQAELRWRAPAVHVRVRDDATPERALPALIVQLLNVGRRRQRFIPLAAWRHLGIYGAGAHAAAHHLIGTLLCQQHPDELALTVLDRQGWAALYRGTPHWVNPPGDGPATADALVRALRGGAAGATRPLLVVLVDPEGAALSAFAALMSRLSLQPTAPVHIVLVQSRLQPLGRQLYLTLPALVTAGAAAPELLPAVQQWPRNGSATVLIRGRRWIGRPLVCDEAAAGELTRRLARYPHSAVPVLWPSTT